MKVHDILAENRIRFAQLLNEMSEDLSNLAKEVDKNRKHVRDINPVFVYEINPLCRRKI